MAARSKNILRQLGHPRGLLGRFILWRLNCINRGMNDLTFRALNLTDEDHVLEIGFGGGTLIERILSKTAAQITGTDISTLAIKGATKRYNAAIQKGRLQLAPCDNTALPFENDSFSKACCVNVIYFWSDVAAMLVETHRILKSGGQFIVCYQENAPDGVKKFPPDQVEAILKTTGFIDVTISHGADKLSRSYHCTIATKP
jgi:arsenite methyltransferase